MKAQMKGVITLEVLHLYLKGLITVELDFLSKDLIKDVEHDIYILNE